MSTVEQIVICKFMLFSYIYHHKKVRAAEGMLGKMLERQVELWRSDGHDDARILCQFLLLTDGHLEHPVFRDSKDQFVKEYSERICWRLLPRLVFGVIPNNASKDGQKLKSLGALLNDPNKRDATIKSVENVLARELTKIPALKDSPLYRAGVWFDVPKAPTFEKTESLLIGDDEPVLLQKIFPITNWVQAYEAHRYQIRFFAFSEYFEEARAAAIVALQEIVGMNPEDLIDLDRTSSIP
jgi:HD superfamily phosphohydrolase